MNFAEAQKLIPPCDPPAWARGGHVHTIVAHLLPSEKLRYPVRDFDITLEKESEKIRSVYASGKSSTVIYLFHGVAGSAEDAYIQRIAQRFAEEGHHVFLNNHRGAGKGVGLATEPYHSGRAGDLSYVIDFGKKLLPGHQHIAIGFSLSANILLNLVAGRVASTKPDFAIAVNAPINLQRAADLLQEGANRIYDRRFTRALKDYVRVNRPQDVKKLSTIRNLIEFDDAFTAPLSGTRDSSDYYRTFSSKPHLKDIKVPTVILTAEDDPFVSVLDYQDAQYSPACHVHIERHGGHLGYLRKKGIGYERWLDGALMTYVRAFLGKS